MTPLASIFKLSLIHISGLPVALGAAIACPDRKTVLFEGDGSGMYTAQALWSMAREKANVTIVILKNDDYGIINIELARVREGDANAKMESMINLNNPTLNWVKDVYKRQHYGQLGNGG